MFFIIANIVKSHNWFYDLSMTPIRSTKFNYIRRYDNTCGVFTPKTHFSWIRINATAICSQIQYFDFSRQRAAHAKMIVISHKHHGLAIATFLQMCAVIFGASENFCDEKLCPLGVRHVACNKQSGMQSTCPESASEIMLSFADKKEITDEHNRYRTRMAKQMVCDCLLIYVNIRYTIMSLISYCNNIYPEL